MKKVAIFALAIALVAMASCSMDIGGTAYTAVDNEGMSRAVSTAPTAQSEEGRYLVVFKNKPGNADRDMVRGNGASIMREFDIVPAMAIRVPNEKALFGIMHNPNVELVEVDQVRYALGETVPWGVTAVKAPLVWSQTTGDNVKVAVLDTGIDYNHPDLKANYRGGYDFVSEDSDPFDGNGHGTHCSGTIGAITNNGIGVASVAYNVDLYAVKVLSDEGSGYSSDILAGVDWAVQNGMHIASMSIGGGSYSKTEDNAYTNAYNAGLLVICATGNDGATSISYPAAYAKTMAIGAVDSNLVIADFSNRGTGIHLVAPGVDVLSTVPVGTGEAAEVLYGTQTLAAATVEYSPRVSGLKKAAVYCNLGKAGEFPASVAGNIALIKRGEISFADKATNAKNAGAVGVIIFNNEAGMLYATFGAAGDWLPSVGMSMADGEMLVAAGSPTVTMNIVATDYASFNGTSMATPHASAVAALVKGANPALTNQQIWDILNSTATDLGASGYDTTYGYGIVNAEAAVAAALGGGGDPGQTVTDTFTGTLAKGASASHYITVSGGVIDAVMSWNNSKATMSLTLYNPSGKAVASGTTSLSYDTKGVTGQYRLLVKNTSRTKQTATYTLKATYLP